MRRYVAALLVLVIAILSSGCATFTEAWATKQLNLAEMQKAYYNQGKDGRTYHPMTLEAAPGEVMTISGLAKITFTVPHEPLSVYPRKEGAMRTFFDGLWKVGTVLLGWDAATGLIDAVQNPSIHEPSVHIIGQ